ncbi:hypothetical protein FB567DRAFT_553429 [Paraphoma chrysanthemicola]|uniref:Uncharacterized protein n=1 Tax=Paraphoma chrysanthemicola TaxID=798071 RepID=A0A8K0QVP2_9PLEO|nr:hypothetical protein FB567DRAFT_553429 [Paraphoma chrysanthemicola]
MAYIRRSRRYGSAPPDFPSRPKGNRPRRDAPLPRPVRRPLGELATLTLIPPHEQQIRPPEAAVDPLRKLVDWICTGLHPAGTLLLTLCVILLAAGAYNVHCFQQAQLKAFQGKGLDAIHPSCVPKRLDATCPSILGIPPLVYERLVVPRGAVRSFYRQAMKCWAPDKAHRHPGVADGRLAENDLKMVRKVLERCRDVMSLGTGYPRTVEVGAHSVEIQHSDLWDLSSWNTTWYLPWEVQRPSHCIMDMAVSAYLWSPFTPRHHSTDNSTNNDACTIDFAWSSYTYIFNISIASSIPWPSNLRIALGWLAMKHKISFPHPLALVLPQPVLHGFHEHRLPPRGQHAFWVDTDPQGLPYHASTIINVPTMLTDELRKFGRDGVHRYSQMESRQAAMPAQQKRACIIWGWCFKSSFAIAHNEVTEAVRHFYV